MVKEDLLSSLSRQELPVVMISMMWQTVLVVMSGMMITMSEVLMEPSNFDNRGLNKVINDLGKNDVIKIRFRKTK